MPDALLVKLGPLFLGNSACNSVPHYRLPGLGRVHLPRGRDLSINVAEILLPLGARGVI